MLLSQSCELIGRLLREELESSARLLAVLKTEHEAIAQRDTDTLQQVVADKQQLLEQLDGCHGRRVQLMQDAGLASGRESFENILSQCADAGSDLASGWSEVKDMLLACQRQNQINGTVLESSRRTTHQALGILLGGQGDDTELYNQAGKSTPSTIGGRKVIKA